MSQVDSNVVVGQTRWKSLGDLTRAKTIATVGPACAKREQLAELILQGVEVFRLNMAHGTRVQHQAAVDDIRWARQHAGVPVAILVDLAGPKIRLGAVVCGNIAMRSWKSFDVCSRRAD